jgi:hypothetical protein
MPAEMGVLANLPPEIAYLAEAALSYGRYQFDGEILEFLDAASAEELSELSDLAERVRRGRHYDLVNRFLDEYPMQQSPEAACL